MEHRAPFPSTPDPSRKTAVLSPGGHFSRRQFIGGMAVMAAGALVLRRRAALAADPPSVVQVLIEDLPLTPDQLANGVLGGVQWMGDAGLSLLPGRAAGTYISPVLTAKTDFTHAGLHWSVVPPDAIDFQLRVSSDGRTWSGWRNVLQEPHPPAGGRETYSTLVSVGRASQVQLRAAFDSNRGDAVLRSVSLVLLNSRDGPTSPGLDLAAAPASTTPLLSGGRVYRRELWGADESLRFKDGAEIWPSMFVPVKKAVVHHTASTNDYETLDEAMAEVRAIYAYHAVSLGWGDIGYNAIIDKWGNVYEGRYGRGSGVSRETFSPGVAAGHAFFHNFGSTGIALLGTFTAPGENEEPGVAPSDAMLASLVDVLAFECDRHNIDPAGAGDFLLSTDAWNRGLANIPGHRNCTPTICPGGYVYERLPALRAAVGARLRRTAAPPSLTAYAGERATPNSIARVKFDWGAAEGAGSVR